MDVVVTSFAAYDYNKWYREHQAKDLIEFISKSTADHLILAGDFKVDLRDNEYTLKTVMRVLHNTMGDELLFNPYFTTLGNHENTYSKRSKKGVIHDYIFHKNQGLSLQNIKILNLLTKTEELSFSNHQALSAKFYLHRNPIVQ